MSSNLFKAGWVVVKDDKRVINSNDLVERRVKEAAERQAMLAFTEEEAETEFSAGLEAEQISSLLDQEGEEAVLKSAALEAQSKAEEALQEAEERLAQAQMQAEQILLDAQSQAEELREQVMHDAHEQGYRDGYAEGMAQLDAMKSECQEKENQLLLDYRRMTEELEPTFIETLTGIYEHIFKVDLRGYSQLVAELVMDAMRKTETRKNYIIHCSKADFPVVSNEKERIQEETGTSGSNVEIVSDMTLAPSQCMIETESGVYDCSLETELTELKKKLILLSYKK